MLANDLAKMPLILRETKRIDGRVRTQPAIDNPLYTLLKDCPNSYQTSYQMRWFLASQLIMNSNCYCQILTDQAIPSGSSRSTPGT
jgi:phage portal protein BeeE